MPRHPKLIEARHRQGLAAYRAGHGIDHVMEIAHEIEQMHETAQTEDEHREIQNSVPSFIAGFLTGLIDDIRSISANPNVQRRGQTA